MFTGIIEELGTIAHMDRRPDSIRLTIQAHKVLEGTQLGDSIAVNGVCLTVTDMTDSTFSADVMHETMRRSSFSTIKSGSQVNLERAMQVGGRLGGHIVSGHIDGIGHVARIATDGIARVITISIPKDMEPFIVEKGSITIDGISLTVAAVDGEGFSVSTIPHTVAQTNLSQRRQGDPVNLETDVVGKYIEKLLRPEETKPHTPANESTLTKEMLLRCGF